MVEVLNKAGPFSANSEVVIAAPSIHLGSMKSLMRPDIAVSAEDVGFKKGYGAYTGNFTCEKTMVIIKQHNNKSMIENLTEYELPTVQVNSAQRSLPTSELNGL
jgi:triosephosphate isomerase